MGRGKGSSELETLRAQLRAEYRKPWQEARKETPVETKPERTLHYAAHGVHPARGAPMQGRTSPTGMQANVTRLPEAVTCEACRALRPEVP